MIRIVNRRTEPGAQGDYVGRPSVLGNPFPLRREADRAEVCDRYRAWLAEHAAKPGPVRSALLKLAARYRRDGVLTLVCWCAPARCHAESIRNWILDEAQRP